MKASRCASTRRPSRVARKPPQFDQRLPFKWRGLAAAGNTSQTPGTKSTTSPHRRAAEAGDRLKYSVAARFDKADDLVGERFEKFAVAVVNEEQFKIGGISHFAAAEFAKSEDREGHRSAS